MTRNEAIEKIKNISGATAMLEALETLKLIKFDPEPNVEKLYENVFFDGNVRLEKWSEGICLWYAGEIVWRSWKA